MSVQRKFAFAGGQRAPAQPIARRSWRQRVIAMKIAMQGHLVSARDASFDRTRNPRHITDAASPVEIRHDQQRDRRLAELIRQCEQLFALPARSLERDRAAQCKVAGSWRGGIGNRAAISTRCSRVRRV